MVNESLKNQLKYISFLSADFKLESAAGNVETQCIHYPDAEFAFLHESAIIEFHGTLFAAWYNCPEKELEGRTIIRGCRSHDGGKNWDAVETLCEDPEGKLQYCPPVFGVSDDTPYMLVNTMIGFDKIHSLEYYRFNETTKKFEFFRSEPLPFKLNCNAERPASGKLLLAGRTGKLDELLEIPAVMLSDSGKMTGPWRIVPFQKDNSLPEGNQFVFPETSVIVQGETIYAFTRWRSPLVYVSTDSGESWSAPMRTDIPLGDSKIYSGHLADGKNYIIGNEISGREQLFIAFTEPEKLTFVKGVILRNGNDPAINCTPEWSYPIAHECDSKLYIIYTTAKKGAMLSIVDLTR